jgi:sulfotransferase
MKQQFFISGLPRSGSTLLSAILRQNPKIYADIASPINVLVDHLLYTNTNGFNALLTSNKIKQLIKSTFDVCYNDIQQEVIFDTNRCWSGKLELLKDIFPNTKIICCVRDINSILNSFEHVYRQNIYRSNSIVYGNNNSNIYQRCHSLMDDVLGVGLTNLKTGIHSANSDMIYLVEYDDLIIHTKDIVTEIYKFCELEYFEHDYDNITNVPHTVIVDTLISLPGLHDVRSTIMRREIPQYLPHDLMNQFSGMEYWRN